MPIIIALVVIVAIVLLVVVGNYNQITALLNNRQQAFADVDVQLNQRYDLIPNLVNIVKGYAKHEKDTLTEVTKMRTAAMGAQNIEDKINAENQFSSTLKTLFAVSENYPQLKADANFRQLQEELSDIENKIAAARRFFNNTTKEYNTLLMSFPGNVLNSFFNFQRGTFFDLGDKAEETRKNVIVDMSE